MRGRLAHARSLRGVKERHIRGTKCFNNKKPWWECAWFGSSRTFMRCHSFATKRELCHTKKYIGQLCPRKHPPHCLQRFWETREKIRTPEPKWESIKKLKKKHRIPPKHKTAQHVLGPTCKLPPPLSLWRTFPRAKLTCSKVAPPLGNDYWVMQSWIGGAFPWQPNFPGEGSWWISYLYPPQTKMVRTNVECLGDRQNWSIAGGEGANSHVWTSKNDKGLTWNKEEEIRGHICTVELQNYWMYTVRGCEKNPLDIVSASGRTFEHGPKPLAWDSRQTTTPPSPGSVGTCNTMSQTWGIGATITEKSVPNSNALCDDPSLIFVMVKMGQGTVLG